MNENLILQLMENNNCGVVLNKKGATFLQYVPKNASSAWETAHKCHYEFETITNGFRVDFHCEDKEYAPKLYEALKGKVCGDIALYSRMQIVFKEFTNGQEKEAVEKMEEVVNEFGQIISEAVDSVNEVNHTNSKIVNSVSENVLISRVKKLLLSNHNIILHGAPGTGKTYLAKEIASQMIFGCSLDKLTEDQNIELKQQIGFVQFHQSYDYTDFVEGLRPVKGRKDLTEGFARQNGVFKEFCCKALSNEIISSKTPEDIKKESEWRKKIDTYLEKFKNENPGLKTSKKKNDFSISDFDEELVYINSPSNPKTSELFCKIDDLVQLLSSNKEFKSVKDLEKFFKLASHRQIHSYEIVIVNKIRDLERQQPIQIEIVEDENVIEPIEIEKKKDFIFIIDEINRGEMSKIFGELFYSIDPGYRGKKGRINTQYQNLVEEDDIFADGFFVPENVYIIGTMNDIDRSVESMDFAMRRRFAFKEIKASDRIEMLDDLKCGKKEEAVARMTSINSAIENVPGLSTAYHIGPAYFLKLDNYEGDFDLLWEYHIEGVLREYLRGMPDAGETLQNLHDAYNLKVSVSSEG